VFFYPVLWNGSRLDVLIHSLHAVAQQKRRIWRIVSFAAQVGTPNRSPPARFRQKTSCLNTLPLSSPVFFVPSRSILGTGLVHSFFRFGHGLGFCLPRPHTHLNSVSLRTRFFTIRCRFLGHLCGHAFLTPHSLPLTAQFADYVLQSSRCPWNSPLAPRSQAPFLFSLLFGKIFLLSRTSFSPCTVVPQRVIEALRLLLQRAYERQMSPWTLSEKRFALS